MDKRTRKVKVNLERVVFLDGKVTRYNNDDIKTREQQTITTLNSDLVEQLDRELANEPSTIRMRVRYIPQQMNDYWLCFCGRPNKNTAQECCRCGITKSNLFEKYTVENLQKNSDKHKLMVQKKDEEEKARQGVRKKRIKVASLIGAACGLVLAGYLLVIVPITEVGEEYQTAITLLQNEKYEEAISLLISLGNYKDSKEKVSDVAFILGNQYVENHEWRNALDMFEKVDINVYPDIESKIQIAQEGLANEVWSFTGAMKRTKYNLTDIFALDGVLKFSGVTNEKVDLTIEWSSPTRGILFTDSENYKNLSAGRIIIFTEIKRWDNFQNWITKGESETWTVKVVESDSSDVLAEFEFIVQN